MYLFFLGVILGFGLHAAVRGGLKTLELRRINRAHKVELEVQRRVNERLNPMGWDSIPERVSSGPRRFTPITHP